MPLTGHCLCGAVTYTAEVDQPLITAYDHCDDCQRQTGSTYSLVAVVPKDSLTIKGPTKSWAGLGSSGKAVHRIFCSECGSPIAHDPEAAPPIIALKAGTLDTEIKKNLKPDTEIWTVWHTKVVQSNAISGMSSGTLLVKDSRTNKQYEILIMRNAMAGRGFGKIKAPGRGTNRADQVSDGLRVHDPGLFNTTVLETGISFSAYERGMILSRDYSLEDMWNSEFEDMSYLLVWGSYPTEAQREKLRQNLARDMLAGPDSVKKAVHAMPATTPPLPPSLESTYCENLFIMSELIDLATGYPDPLKVSCFRHFAMLNSEHGMALTVFSALVAASGLTDPISCHISSVTAAWGPLHVAATESMRLPLPKIRTIDMIPAFLDEVKKGRRKLFGYGHRCYKGIDPRVRPIQSILTDLQSTDLLKLAEAIEQAASEDDYFRSRGLYLNADFYGNFVFTGIGFELEVLPAAMLTQRIIGIMAHWREYMRNAMTVATKTTPLLSSKKKPYSRFTPSQKCLIVLTAATASPLSANIYYTALNALATDLHVSPAQINLTITTYMITQSISPTFTTSFADTAGRRPAYFLCFAIYITANNAIALQHSYPALLILRTLQSTGISGTVALASAVAADIITLDERGVYMGFTSLGNSLAPSLGPILEGVVCEYAWWRTVFWFLALSAGVVGIGMVMWFPETCRAVVGDGSALNSSSSSSSTSASTSYFLRDNSEGKKKKKKRNTYNPHKSLRILFDLPTALLLLSNALIFASYYAIMTGIPSLFKEMYALSELGIRLVFIPAGLGSLASAKLNGVLLLSTLPILLYALLFLPRNPKFTFPLPIPLILIFLISCTITASYNVLNVLLVDLYYTTPASVMATNNLVRCLFGAASTALMQPAFGRLGVATTYALVVGIAPSTVKKNVQIRMVLLDLLLHLFLLLLRYLLSAAQHHGPLPLDLPILHLRYPHTPWIFPGDTIPMKHTRPLPEISRLGLDPGWTYHLLSVDLDVPNMRISRREHFWLEPAGYTKGDEDGMHGLVNSTSSGAEYIAPQPPPNSHHLYVYLLYRQQRGYKFPICFGHIFPMSVEARAGFDMRQFTDVAGLQFPVAGNYFYSPEDCDV
ncbi:hypothetical protein BJY01DRAFT_235711 [Aspergillus pseudoustus]|uniref:Citrate synthase n=1 Tax=Aspergillus pseudoustus TaxID=1810923 RepID=A0ABR4JTF3_9EURO